MAFSFTDSMNDTALRPIKKAHINELIVSFNTIVNSVKFSPAYAPTIDAGSTSTNVPKKISLLQLQTQINTLESKFSNNCDCLQNLNCCQTCQTTTCQSQCKTSNCDCGNCSNSH